jgi:hypothetical protein
MKIVISTAFHEVLWEREVDSNGEVVILKEDNELLEFLYRLGLDVKISIQGVEFTRLGNIRTDENFFEGICPAIRESDGLDCVEDEGHFPETPHRHEYVRWTD